MASRCRTALVEPPVAAADGDRVLQRVAGDERPRARARFDEVDDQRAGAAGDVALGRIGRRHVVGAHRRQAHHRHRRRHRVRRVLPAAGAGAGTGVALEPIELGLGRACRRRRRRRPRRRPGSSRRGRRGGRARWRRRRARRPGRSSRASAIARGRDRLVAADQRDHAVDHVAERDQLDAVGDDLARDQRRRACPACPWRCRRRRRSC